jgi:putative ABC transport system permease protein
LTENLLLTGVAALAGWLLAAAGLRLVMALLPIGTIPPETTIEMNVPVLLLSLGIAVLTSLFCSVAPLLYLTRLAQRPRLTPGLKGDTARGTRLRRGLVVAQIALAMALLVGAGALMRGFLALTRVDLGFDPSNVLYVRPWFPQQYDTADEKNAFTRELLRRLQAMPGVVSAAESMLVPPLTHDWSDTIIPGKPHTERWETRIEICSEGYFQTIGLRLVRGALFTESDVAAKRLVTVVNETFMRRYFPDEEPLGKRVKFQVLDRPFLDAPHDVYFEIIGVVADHRTWGGQWEMFPQAFFPYSVQGFSFRTFLARTAVPPESLLPNVREAVWAIDPSVGIAASGTIDRSLTDFYRDPQFDLALLGSFSLIGLALVASGLFGVMAYTVSLKTHEIGVRMAIGARRTQILKAVLLQGAALVGSGTLCGLAVAFLFSRVLLSTTFASSTPDPLTVGAAALLIVSVGLIACYVPAHRAATVDPLTAIRSE